MKKATAFVVSFLIVTIFANQALCAPLPHKPRSSVDIAVLLDTSNSMDGLINQAKGQIWTIVQEFSHALKDGQAPVLRVALFEYGNTRLPASEGYLRQVVPLSDDLDVLSEALFALSTDGGDEYCGQVIDEAITRLDWNTERGSYRAIFIAGNEPFSQGPIDYVSTCQRAQSQNIIINTIHCGDYQTGADTGWETGAKVGKGEFLNINQDENIRHIPAPQDDDIVLYNQKLNETYLWFGSADKREYCLENQVAQDSNVQTLSPSAGVERCVTKAGKAYSNSTRDLVDALENDTEILANTPEEELPEEMQKMTEEEREEYLAEMAAKRAELRKKIGELAAEREEFLAKEKVRLAEESGDETLGDAMVSAVRNQLLDNGFEVNKK